MFSVIPKVQIYSNHWNSTYNLIKQVCEQQLSISSVLLQRQHSLMYLELLPNEWHILEDIVKLLRPFKITTQYLFGESILPSLHWGPYYMKFKSRDIAQHFKKLYKMT